MRLLAFPGPGAAILFGDLRHFAEQHLDLAIERISFPTGVATILCAPVAQAPPKLVQRRREPLHFVVGPGTWRSTAIAAGAVSRRIQTVTQTFQTLPERADVRRRRAIIHGPCWRMFVPVRHG